MDVFYDECFWCCMDKFVKTLVLVGPTTVILVAIVACSGKSSGTGRSGTQDAADVVIDVDADAGADSSSNNGSRCYVGDDGICAVNGAEQLPMSHCFEGPPTIAEHSACFDDSDGPAVTPRACCPSMGAFAYYDPAKGCTTRLADGLVNFGCYVFGGSTCGYPQSSACYARTTSDGGYEYSLSSGTWIDSVMRTAGFTDCGTLDSALPERLQDALPCP